MTQNWVMFFKKSENLSLVFFFFALWHNFAQIKKLIIILHI